MHRSSLFALLFLAGCTTTAMPTDVGSDAGTSPDAVILADAPTLIDAAPLCSVTPAPSGLLALTGTFQELPASGPSPIPVQTGGDPTGVWRFDRATIFTAPGSSAMFDAATSSIEGTGWAVLEGNALRLEMTLNLTVRGTVAGTVRRHNVTTIRGTFAVSEATLMITPECIEPMPMAGMSATTFTASGTTGSLVLTTSGMLGTNQILLTGTRTPS